MRPLPTSSPAMIASVAHHVKVVPVRLRERDAGLACDRLRGIGFRCVCECGERSPVRDTVKAARAWKAEHAALSGAHGTRCDAK